MSEPCEKCGADISFQGETHTNCQEVVRLIRSLHAARSEAELFRKMWEEAADRIKNWRERG